MEIGYARVSTTDQSMALQRDALKKAGVKEIFEDVTSGANANRPGLKNLLRHTRSGDTIVVWRLDRLGRSLRHLIELVELLTKRKVGLRSLQENIDTTSAGGKLFLHMFGALAEFERELIRERTVAGLQSARIRGRKGGRPKVMDLGKIQLAKTLHKDKDVPIAEICRILGVSKGTFYRHI
jgi:DNA invertase Pin-like site-specific DNA recombinase